MKIILKPINNGLFLSVETLQMCTVRHDGCKLLKILIKSQSHKGCITDT